MSRLDREESIVDPWLWLVLGGEAVLDGSVGLVVDTESEETRGLRLGWGWIGRLDVKGE